MENRNEQLKNFQVAEIQLTYKSNIKPSLRPKITGSRQAYDLLINNWDKERIELIEQFKVILLNRAHKVLGLVDLSTGGVSGTIADPKLIFVAALKAGASSIILAHNHPSGNSTASDTDIELTRKCSQGGKFLEIQVLDHIIVTTEGYMSFADEGLI